MRLKKRKFERDGQLITEWTLRIYRKAIIQFKITEGVDTNEK